MGRLIRAKGVRAKQVLWEGGPLRKQALWVAPLWCALVLSASACEPLRQAGDAFTRLSNSTSSAQNRSSNKTRAAAQGTPVGTRADPQKADSENPKSGSSTVASAESINLVGRSEHDIRALLGPPTAVEDNPPGKTWRYRDGRCSLDVQLYPDIKTRQFGTLGYDVKSDDNTSEGKRLCLGQFRSRVQAGRE
jgi:hypothetical protein